MKRPTKGAQEIHQAQYGDGPVREPFFFGAFVGESAERQFDDVCQIVAHVSVKADKRYTVGPAKRMNRSRAMARIRFPWLM